MIPESTRDKLSPELKQMGARLLSRTLPCGDGQTEPASKPIPADKLRRDYFFLGTLSSIQARAHQVVTELQRSGCKPDLVIAHEIVISGLAGLEVKKKFPIAKLLLDNVEYPQLSGRSSVIGSRVRKDPIAGNLISAFLAGVANQYDRIIATSQGQAETLGALGVTKHVDLIRNARVRPAQPTHQLARRWHVATRSNQPRYPPRRSRRPKKSDSDR